MLSYLCSQHLTGLGSVAFGRLSTMVLQLQRDKESKVLQSLLPPAPGPAASQPSHVCLSVCACCFIWGAEQKPAPCPVLWAEMQLHLPARAHSCWQGTGGDRDPGSPGCSSFSVVSAASLLVLCRDAKERACSCLSFLGGFSRNNSLANEEGEQMTWAGAGKGLARTCLGSRA